MAGGRARAVFLPVLLPSLGEHFLGDAIGSGVFSTVYRASRNGLTCAVKRLDREHFDDPVAVRTFRMNAELMLGLHHTSCLTVLGVVWRLEKGFAEVCLIMEQGTSLHELVSTPHLSSQLSWSKHKLTLAMCVVRGVAYLHSLRLQHANLKPHNVILLDAGASGVGSNAKLADPSASDEAVARTMRQLDTKLYAAPETLKGEMLSPQGDLWAVGALLEVLWTHLPVYHVKDRTPEEALEQVRQRQLRPSLPSAAFLAKLVESCCEFEPTKRLGAAEVCRSAPPSPPLHLAHSLPSHSTPLPTLFCHVCAA